MPHSADLERALALCVSVRGSAVWAASNASDCLVLGRLVGKTMLLLECFNAWQWQEGTTFLPPQIISDVVEALQSVEEAVAGISCMSRLQAVLQAEESHSALKAAAKDLRCALAGLAQVKGVLPADAAEDLEVAQRQLSQLKLDPRSADAQLGAHLSSALTLLHLGCTDAAASAGVLLDRVMGRAKLDPADAAVWIDSELQLLACAAAAARQHGDSVAEFCLQGAAMCLLARYLGTWEQWSSAADIHAAINGARDGDSHDSSGGTEERADSAVCCLLASWFRRPPVRQPCSQPPAIALAEATVQALSSAVPAPAASPEAAGHLGSAGQQPRLRPGHTAAIIDALLSAELLEVASEPLRQFQAAVLLGHAAETAPPPALAALRDAGAVPAVLACLRGARHPAVLAAVAAALRHLCKDAAARAAVVAQPGAVALLVRLLQSPDAAPRNFAARALGNVVVGCEAAKKDVAACGGILSLVRMLDGADGDVAAAALGNLAASSQCLQALIGDTEAIPCLVELLRRGSPAAQQHASRALRNLSSRLLANKEKALAAGAVAPLTALLYLNDAAPLQAAAAAACLSNLMCGCKPVHAESAAPAALPALLSMLRESSPVACREAAAWALSNLAAAESGRAFVEPEFIPLLVNLLCSKAEGGQQAAARAVKSLSAGAYERNKLALVAAGVVPPLVAMLGSKQDAVRRSAATSLWNLAFRCDVSRGEITRAGGVEAVVRLLQPGASSEATRQEAARALSNLSCNNTYGQVGEMQRCGAIPLLVDMMRTGGDAAKELAAAAISNLACLPRNQAEILQHGALPLLLDLLAVGAAPACRESAALAVGNLAADGAPPELLAAASEATALLSELARTSASLRGKVAAARALGNLACSHDHADGGRAAVLMSQAGGTDALVELCQSPNAEVREAAVHALQDVCSCGEAGRRAVAAAGAIPWLAQLLLFADSAGKEEAAACLAELAVLGPGTCQEIREAGAVARLENLAAGSSSEVAATAAAALRAYAAGCAAPASSRDAGTKTAGPTPRTLGSTKWKHSLEVALLAQASH